MSSDDLVAAFLAALSPAEQEPAAALPDLGERLAALVSEAQAAWPEVEVPAAELVAYMAARLPSGVAALSSGPRAADFFVACACARGDGPAIDGFQKRYFGEIDLAGKRARAADGIVAEARQNVARVLFTGPTPAIAGYSGRGDLRGWIRVTAIREVLRLIEQSRNEVPIGADSFFDALSPVEDPELVFLKDRYRVEFAEAFRAAVAVLSDRERELFQHQLLDGWGIDDFAAHHGVHRSTAARWLAAARRTLLDQTRERLKERWGADTLEVDSMLRLLTSRLDVSLERAIRAEPSG